MTKFHVQALLSLRPRRLTLFFSVWKFCKTQAHGTEGDRGITPKVSNAFSIKIKILVLGLIKKDMWFWSHKSLRSFDVDFNVKKYFLEQIDRQVYKSKIVVKGHNYTIIVLCREKCLARNLIYLARTTATQLGWVVAVCFWAKAVLAQFRIEEFKPWDREHLWVDLDSNSY